MRRQVAVVLHHVAQSGVQLAVVARVRQRLLDALTRCLVRPTDRDALEHVDAPERLAVVLPSEVGADLAQVVGCLVVARVDHRCGSEVERILETLEADLLAVGVAVQLHRVRRVVAARDRRSVRRVERVVEVLAAELATFWGGIDVLVNAVGVAARTPSVSVSVERVRETLEVSVLAEAPVRRLADVHPQRTTLIEREGLDPSVHVVLNRGLQARLVAG